MRSALIIVDVQNDFCKNGSLEVPNANIIIPLINKLRTSINFDLVVRTLDYHPQGHISFASVHNAQPFTSVKLRNGETQQLWPDHCVQNTFGSENHQDLLNKKSDIIIRKGTKKEQDAYSGFGEGIEITELQEILKKNDIQKVFCVGLAFDFCVGSTAFDAGKFGFDTIVLKDFTKSVSAEFEEQMKQKLSKQQNIKIVSGVNMSEIQNLLK